MKVDNPQAFRFIMQDEIYLLEKDKGVQTFSRGAVITEAENPNVTEQSAVNTEKPPVVTEPDTRAIDPMPQPIVETPDSEFNYLGKNNKNFLILVSYPQEEHIAPPHLTALESILKRKELLLDDVAILNVNKHATVTLAALAAYFTPTKLVIMGKESLPKGIGNLPLNKPLQGKKTHVLYSFSFDEMMSSNDNKKTFWEHMKTL